MNKSKVCINHPQNVGVVYCKKCNGYICKDCILNINGKRICKSCYYRKLGQELNVSNRNEVGTKTSSYKHHKIISILLSSFSIILFFVYLNAKHTISIQLLTIEKLQKQVYELQYGAERLIVIIQKAYAEKNIHLPKKTLQYFKKNILNHP